VKLLALLAALLAATVVPNAPPGIGATAVAALVAAAAWTQARRTSDLYLFGGLALALALSPALLDARWVVSIDLFAAWVCASVAVGGPSLRAIAAPATSLPRLPGLLPHSSSRAVPVVRAAAIATLVAIPFAVLFLTADAAFAAVADSAPRPELGSVPARVLIFGLVLVAAAALALAAAAPGRAARRSRTSRLTSLEWVLPLVLLDGLFLAFVGVQVRVLFGGDDYVVRTTGLTYSEYARQGFWQLIAAGALTLLVVQGAARLAQPRTRRERLLRNALVGLLCALTVVVVASALHRLRLYEDAYGLTRPRLAAEAFSLWLAGTFVLVVVLGLLRRGAAFPRLALVWSATALVIFSAADPDALIADRNVARWEETGRIDTTYLSTLSADAVPALERLPTSLREEAAGPIEERLRAGEPWTSANVSRARARRLLADG
jgi:Domain of unknown function (DUF4173)